MIGSVLIANRGEIAARLIRTYRARGIRTVAVYSDADVAALHVRLADEARRLGPAPVTASYLNQDAILAAARDAGADAVDPGYGLLSEDPGFAGAVAAAGLVFVGPPAAAIVAMGDKLTARSIARRAGLPVVPGSGAIRHPEQGLSEAARLGYPVLVKAAGGGGGHGPGRVQARRGLRRAAGPEPGRHTDPGPRDRGPAGGRGSVAGVPARPGHDHQAARPGRAVAAGGLRRGGGRRGARGVRLDVRQADGLGPGPRDGPAAPDRGPR